MRTLIHFHVWSRWTDPVDTGNGVHKQQWRVCIHCNCAAFRTLSWDKQTSLCQITESLKIIRGEMP